MDTNACIEHFAKGTDIPREVLEEIVPPAIDAVYAARDTGHFMHFAGASAAVAAYQALQAHRLASHLPDAETAAPADLRRPAHGGHPSTVRHDA